MGLLSNAFYDIKVKDEKEAPVIKQIMVDVTEPIDVKTRQESVELPSVEEFDNIDVTLFEFKTGCVLKMSENYDKDLLIIEYTPRPNDMSISFQRIFDDSPSPKVTDYNFSTSRLPIKYTLCRNGYRAARVNVVLLSYAIHNDAQYFEAYEILLP
jgi:hypothetical protein